MKRLFLPAAAVLIVIAICLWQSDWLDQDRCLDSGGRWSPINVACQR